MRIGFLASTLRPLPRLSTSAGPGRSGGRTSHALVQGQHAHAHAQQRRRQHAGRRRALVPRARLSVSRADRSQLPDERRRPERAARRRRAVPRHPRRGSELASRRQADPRQRPRRRAAGRAAHGRRPSATSCSATSTAIRSASGVPHINHPNFRWAITGRGAAAGPQQPAVRDLQRPPAGQQGGRRWRARTRRGVGSILSSGTLLYGIAVDDAHVFKQPGNPRVAGPAAAG